MPRYVAFLRGVSPLNAKNSQLKQAFEGAGFTDVKTVLSSGNVAFSADSGPEKKLARRAEEAMTKYLARTFYTIVRPSTHLLKLIETNPITAFSLPPNAKLIFTFLGEQYTSSLSLPIEISDGWILAVLGGDVLSAYIPSPRGSPIMRMIEKIFGSNVTTRTWDTVKRCAGT